MAPADRIMRDLSPVDGYILHVCIFKAPLNSECDFIRSHSLLKTSGGREEGHQGCLVSMGLQGVWHYDFAIRPGKWLCNLALELPEPGWHL